MPAWKFVPKLSRLSLPRALVFANGTNRGGGQRPRVTQDTGHKHLAVTTSQGVPSGCPTPAEDAAPAAAREPPQNSRLLQYSLSETL